MTRATEQVRRQLAADTERMVRSIFTGRIKVDKGVFLATILTIRMTTIFSWGGSWTRDIDSGPRKGQKQRITRVYTMPVVVAQPATDIVVTSRLASYGPWLEGTGSRNETTRFKGYMGFRISGQEMDLTAPAIADRVLAMYMPEMNS